MTQKEINWRDVLNIPKGVQSEPECYSCLREQKDALEHLGLRIGDDGKYYGKTPDGTRQIKFVSVNSIAGVAYQEEINGVRKIKFLPLKNVKPEVITRGVRAISKKSSDFK